MGDCVRAVRNHMRTWRARSDGDRRRARETLQRLAAAAGW